MNLKPFILAGGKSSRMGRDKGLLQIGNTPLVTYVANALQPEWGKPVIITSNEAYKEYGFTIIPDKIPDKGPLGGLYTALCNTNYDFVLLLSCDLPNIQKILLERLVHTAFQNAKTVVPVNNDGKKEPLVAVYHSSVVSVAEYCLKTGVLAMHRFLEMIPYIGLQCNDSDCKSFLNLNTPDAYMQHLKNLGYNVGI